MLKLLRNSNVPIAIDFGYGELKCLQVAPGEPGTVLAAARAEVPDELRGDAPARHEWLLETLPRLLRDGRFRGRSAVCSIPAWQTLCQHLQVTGGDEPDLEAAIENELMLQTGCAPAGLVIRHEVVREVSRQGQSRTEVICFAISREAVMRQVELCEKVRLDIAGLHAEPLAMVKAFGRLFRRQGDDEITTLFIDLGANSAKVVIAHGATMRFAKSIPVGSRHFDRLAAEAFDCDLAEARRRRCLATSARAADAGPRPRSGGVAADAAGGTPVRAAEPAHVPGDGTAPTVESSAGATAAATATAAAPERRQGALPGEFSPLSDSTPEGPSEGGRDERVEDLVDQLFEEIGMCVRYHEGLFPERRLDRAVLVGGESRDAGLCARIGAHLGVPTFRGDPLSRLRTADDARLVDVDPSEPRPGWAVAFGLQACPTS